VRVNKEAQQAMGQWLSQTTPPEQQIDRRWIGRYRELTSQDSYWWLSWAGPFTEEEQRQWDRLYTPPVGEATKELVAPLLKQSRERELEAALAEQREPRLWYPAIEINEVRRRITALVGLAAEIEREEPNEIVRLLYHGAIENDVDYLRMIEATHEGDTERYRALNQRIFHVPTPDEMTQAFTWVRKMIQQGIERPATTEISQRLISFLHERLHLSLDLSAGKDDPPLVRARTPVEQPQTISAEAARAFYDTVLWESGYEGWQVIIDYAGGGTRVESGLRQLILSQERFTLEQVRILLAHELAGHVARSFAGEHSPIGLLGIGTRDYAATEEGLALYHERRVDELHGQVLDDSGLMSGMLATGLASGVVTPPQTFSSLYTFFETLLLLYRLLRRPWEDVQTAQKRVHRLVLTRCLRTYRGVPDLGQAGVCHLQDVTYLRGLLLIERMTAEDETVLDRLAVGKIACALLPLLHPLKMIPPPQPLRQLAYDPELDSYILSFASLEEDAEKLA
jgi:Domain of unknown function (DUF1704)